jgi:ligand-binding sensor protein
MVLASMSTTTNSSKNTDRTMSLQMLAAEPRLQEWMALFHQATGLAIRLVGPDMGIRDGHLCGHEHDFCRQSGILGSPACQETRTALRQKVETHLAPVEHTCATGLTEVAVPLVVDRRHVGTLLVGQTMCSKPDAASWDKLLDSMDEDVVEIKQLQSLKKTYLKGHVVRPDALKPLVQMVALHSHRLARHLKPPAAKPAKKRTAKRPTKKR